MDVRAQFSTIFEHLAICKLPEVTDINKLLLCIEHDVVARYMEISGGKAHCAEMLSLGRTCLVERLKKKEWNFDHLYVRQVRPKRQAVPIWVQNKIMYMHTVERLSVREISAYLTKARGVEMSEETVAYRISLLDEASLKKDH